uniref:Dynein heavy chain ATP-binding dynein motor region domain-containing protein n=1 Tax=Amphimedon queenslandica TaxID=400682 RepID=A0A1X7SZD3_AMPQE
KKNKQQQQQHQGAGPLYSTLNQDDDTPPPVPPAYNPEGVQEYSVLKREGENKGQQGLSTGATGLYSTINKNTNNQVLVDESAHKPVYADLAIADKGKRPQAAPTQEQPVVYASVNNKSVPPPIPPLAAPHKVLYADLSIAASKRTPKNEPPTEERDVESYDPILNPVLNREVKKTGGRVLITFGDQEIDLSPSFTIFLSTRDPSVEFPPDLCSRVTFVNFTVTRSSLQSQCLNRLITIFIIILIFIILPSPSLLSRWLSVICS